MKRPLTIVMYHYVRDLRRSRYPAIKGLDAAEFAAQVAYMKRHYTMISGRDLIDIVVTGATLPANAALLTFDDGYTDHYAEVFPILEREKISGCFFPPAKCVLEHVVLDVNKIHFVLASVPDARPLVEHLFAEIEKNRTQHGLAPAQEYWNRVGVPERFDPAEVVFVKRMLQRELPLEFRTIIVDQLFRKYVTSDEAAFARELYMNEQQLKELHNSGMYVGSHGYDHFAMDKLSPAEQANEIDRSLEFLAPLGVDLNQWIMCYPYGRYDESLLEILKSRRCAAALTTAVEIADLGKDSPLTLPRLDTNDLPKVADGPPNEWTRKTAS